MTYKLLLLAIAPALAICLFIYFKDKHEKEPLKLLLISFFLGVISVIPTLILSKVGEMIFNFDAFSNSIIFSFASCFIGIGLVEEYSKFIFVRYYTYKKKDFNEPFDGIVYCVMVSMGFATLENILYVYKGGESVAWLRMFTAVPMHAVFAVFMGYFIGVQKFYNKKNFAIIGLLIASLIHGIYDFVLMYPDLNAGIKILGFLACIILGIRYSLKAMKIHQEQSPFK